MKEEEKEKEKEGKGDRVSDLKKDYTVSTETVLSCFSDVWDVTSCSSVHTVLLCMCMCMCAAVVYISELITYYLSSTNVHFVVCYFSSVMFMLVHVLESKCNIFSFHCDIVHNTLNTKIIYDYKVSHSQVDCLRLKDNLVELYFVKKSIILMHWHSLSKRCLFSCDVCSLWCGISISSYDVGFCLCVVCWAAYQTSLLFTWLFYFAYYD